MTSGPPPQCGTARHRKLSDSEFTGAASKHICLPNTKGMETLYRGADAVALHQHKGAHTVLTLEESIMNGTRLVSGSATSRLTKRVIAPTPSIRPSSILMSNKSAPCSTCRVESSCWILDRAVNR